MRRVDVEHATSLGHTQAAGASKAAQHYVGYQLLVVASMIRVVLGSIALDSEVLVGERRALFRLAVRVSLSGPTLLEHVATRPRPATVSEGKARTFDTR